MRSLRLVFILAAKQLRVVSRMPGVLAVIFVPGIVMYSIFTNIFAGPVDRPFRAAVVDLDRTESSRALISALEDVNVVVVQRENNKPDAPLLTVDSVRRLIRKKRLVRVAVIIPEGFGEAPDIRSGDRHVGLRLMYDESQRIEADAIYGMIQMAAGRRLFASAAGLLGQGTPSNNDTESPSVGALVRVERIGVSPRQGGIRSESKHVFLAAIVPMFLLFNATGAARSLLEEMASGEMARIRAAPVATCHIIGGAALAAVVLSMLQCYVMYVFAWLVFGVDIWAIEFGYRLLALTVVTCAATTSFGMLLAGLCRTTHQLDAIGTVVILGMSAMGGSMVPRFIMPDFMKTMGLFTINGWSYDGFIGLTHGEGLLPVWRDGAWDWGVFDECAVLVLIAVGCLTLASVLLSRRMQAPARG